MWGLIPCVHPQVLLCVCPRGIIPDGSCVNSSSLLEQPPRHSETSCLDHLCCWTTHISSIASNLLWYTKPWLVDTRLTDETLPILMSTSVNRRAQSQATNKVEGTANCVMTHRLIAPNRLQMWWLPCHYCAIITRRARSALRSLVPHLNIIKTLLK